MSEKDTPTNESDTINGEAPPTSDQDAPTDQALPTTNDAPPTNNEPPPPTTTVYVSHRHLHYPMLHVRPAIVEDNDDLLPILQKSSPESLAEDYGNNNSDQNCQVENSNMHILTSQVKLYM